MFSPVVSLRSLDLRVCDGQSVAFLSDVHLGYGSRTENREREELLLATLATIERTCCHLFIVGDLFDYWFDYRRVVPRDFVATLAALQGMRDRGFPITYLMGNHDFGHFTYFRDELRIHVEQGDLDVTVGDRRWYISHGDGKAANDTGYLVLRSILRSRWAQAVYRWLHPDIGISLASTTSHSSRSYTDERSYGSEDGLRAFAAERLAQGYHLVIMGHRHHAVHESINGGEYVNLGHWLGNDPTYALFTNEEGIRLIRPNGV